MSRPADELGYEAWHQTVFAAVAAAVIANL